MMREREKLKKEISITGTAFSLMSIFMLALILKNSKIAVDYMSAGMKLCTTTVIPSLFPFMVISELIVKSGAATSLGALISPLTSRLFGVGGECGSVFLLGTLCGFPVGTRSGVSLLREGRITKDELRRVICFSNNPSSAFVISAVGGSLFGSRELGCALYVITLLSALLVGIIKNVIERKGSVVECRAHRARLGSLSASVFTDAVSSSALAMLTVCAFVVFFSTFVGVLGGALDALGAPEEVRAILFSLFEMTSGVSAASGLRSEAGIVICAFALGFSGLSVHLQIASLCDGTGVSLSGYFLSKFFQGLLNALLAFVYVKLFYSRLDFDFESVTAFGDLGSSAYVSLASVAFFASVCILLVKRKKELLQKAKAPK